MFIFCFSSSDAFCFINSLFLFKAPFNKSKVLCPSSVLRFNSFRSFNNSAFEARASFTELISLSSAIVIACWLFKSSLFCPIIELTAVDCLRYWAVKLRNSASFVAIAALLSPSAFAKSRFDCLNASIAFFVSEARLTSSSTSRSSDAITIFSFAIILFFLMRKYRNL